MMSRIVGIFISMIVLGISANAEAMTKDTLMANMIKAYGGESSLVHLNIYKQVWHIETKVSDKNGTDNRTVIMPNALTTKLVYPHKTEERILDKGVGIKKFGDKTINVSGPMLDAMKLQLLRVYSPLIISQYSKNVTLSTIDKQFMLSLKVDEVVSEYFVSSETFMIEKVVGRLHLGEQEMEFLTLYQDYKMVNGVMVAHTEVKYAGGINTAIMRLKNMQSFKAK